MVHQVSQNISEDAKDICNVQLGPQERWSLKANYNA